MFFSYRNQYPGRLPDRIRLSNGLTRTDNKTFTDSELQDAGYVNVTPPPSYDSATQRLAWGGATWVLSNLTQEEQVGHYNEMWREVKMNRAVKIQEVEWRIQRYFSESRQGLTLTDDIELLDQYVQALRDITDTTPDPVAVEWPDVPA